MNKQGKGVRRRKGSSRSQYWSLSFILKNSLPLNIKREVNNTCVLPILCMELRHGLWLTDRWTNLKAVKEEWKGADLVPLWGIIFEMQILGCWEGSENGAGPDICQACYPRDGQHGRGFPLTKWSNALRQAVEPLWMSITQDRGSWKKMGELPQERMKLVLLKNM